MAFSDGSHFHGRRSLWCEADTASPAAGYDPVTRDPLRKSRLLADGAVAAEVKVTSHGRGKSGSVKKNACVTSWSCPQR